MDFSQNLHRLQSAWLISLLATMVVLMLAACGGAASAPASPATPAAPKTVPTTVTTSESTPATSPSTSTNSAEIKMVESNGIYSFTPATLTITKGTKVVWTNTSDAPHTVTPDTASAFTASSNLTQNQTYSLVFNTAGTYAYHCSIHSYMKASIIVK